MSEYPGELGYLIGKISYEIHVKGNILENRLMDRQFSSSMNSIVKSNDLGSSAYSSALNDS